MPTVCFPVWFHRRWLLGLAVALSGLAGCAHPLPPAEYHAYLADPAHGLTHTREVNGATITCTYRPTDLLVLQELGNRASTSAARDSVARAYAGKAYCVLTLSKNGGEIENQLINNRPVYEQALTYLNTGIAVDAVLASKATPDSVAALTSMYLRNYGSTGRSTVLLVFDVAKLSTSQGFTLSWHDRQFALGNQRFAFTSKALGAIPALRFE